MNRRKDNRKQENDSNMPSIGEEIWMILKHRESLSTLLIIRKIKSKSKLRHHKIGKIFTLGKYQVPKSKWRKRKSHELLAECKLIESLWNTILLLRLYPKNPGTPTQKNLWF